jgi:hypothetical protein
MKVRDSGSKGTGSKSMGRIIAPLLLLLLTARLAGAARPVPIESVGFRNFDPRTVSASANRASLPILREIRDPHTGVCWQLLLNAAAPAGPAQMTQAATPENSCARRPADQDAQRFAIRRGDRVVVEEHTRAADARLEAVAMGAAMVGSSLDLRLKIGGRVVRAVAIAPGRAALLPVTEVRR